MAHRDVGLNIAVGVKGNNIVIAVNADVSLSGDEGSSLERR